MIAIKRVLVLFSLFLVISSFAFIPFDVAYAEGETEDPLPVGYDLNGYDASIEYHSYTLSGNGLSYSFVVTIDKELFRASGTVENSVFSPSGKIEEIGNIFRAAGYTVKNDGKSEGKIIASIDFDDTVDYYIANGYTGYDVSTKSGTETVGFLFTDYVRTTETAFASIKTENTLLNKVLAKIVELGATEDKVLLTYVYGTPYQIIKTDADRVEYQESSRLYLHFFDMTVDTSERKIEIKQHTPNPTGWYVIAFLCAVPVVAIPLTIMLVRKKQGGQYARD